MYNSKLINAMYYRDSLIDTQQERIENLESIIDKMVLENTAPADYIYIVSEGEEVHAIYKYLDDAIEAADQLNEGVYLPRHLHTIKKYKLKEGADE